MINIRSLKIHQQLIYLRLTRMQAINTSIARHAIRAPHFTGIISIAILHHLF